MLLPTNVYSFTFQNCLAVAIILLSGVLYVSTFISLKKQTKNLALHCASSSNRSQAGRLLKEKRFVRTILLVVCIAVIGIVPYSIAWFVLVNQETMTSPLSKAYQIHLSCQLSINGLFVES